MSSDLYVDGVIVEAGGRKFFIVKEATEVPEFGASPPLWDFGFGEQITDDVLDTVQAVVMHPAVAAGFAISAIIPGVGPLWLILHAASASLLDYTRRQLSKEET